MKILSIEELKKQFNEYQFRFLNIEKSDEFNTEGDMDWLIGEWLIIYDEKDLDSELDYVNYNKIKLPGSVFKSYKSYPFKIKMNGKLVNLLLADNNSVIYLKMLYVFNINLNDYKYGRTFWYLRKHRDYEFTDKEIILNFRDETEFKLITLD